jgi:hypothetical protein
MSLLSETTRSSDRLCRQSMSAPNVADMSHAEMVIAGAAGAHLGGYTEARRVGSSHVNAPRIQRRSEPECGAGAEDRSDQDRRATFPRAGRAVPHLVAPGTLFRSEARVPGRIPPTTAAADLPRRIQSIRPGHWSRPVSIGLLRAGAWPASSSTANVLPSARTTAYGCDE